MKNLELKNITKRKNSMNRLNSKTERTEGRISESEIQKLPNLKNKEKIVWEKMDRTLGTCGQKV